MNTNVNKKRMGLIVLTAVIICAMAVGGTLAYLTASAANKTNHFTFVQGDNVGIVIYEKLWDGSTAEDTDAKLLTETEKANPDLGKNQAVAVMPSMNIPKDPTLENVGEPEVWAAMRLQLTQMEGFCFGEKDNYNIYFSPVYGSHNSDFLVATLKTNGKQGYSSAVTAVRGDRMNNDEVILYINSSLERGQSVTGFDSIEFNAALTTEQIQIISNKISEEDTGNGFFELIIDGFAVQKAGLENSNAKAALTGAFGDLYTGTGGSEITSNNKK